MFGFLANLRDMKSSLSSGMILLFCIWLAFGNAMAEVTSDDTLAGNLRRLTEYIGPVGTLGVITFVAYIIGLVLSLDRRVLGVANRYTVDRRRSMIPMSLTTHQRLEKQLRIAVTNALKKASPGFLVASIFYAPGRLEDDRRVRGIASDEVEEDIKFRLQHLMVSDMDILAVQLHSKHEKTYDKYDKAKTEAEFRASLAIPISVLGAVVMFRLVSEGQVELALVPLMLALCVALTLVVKAVHKQREANEEIVNAVIVGDIEFAPLGTLKDIAEGTIEEKKAPTASIAVPRGKLRM